jgi:phenylalanyl-tRNA synthetase beta chain
MKVSLNWLNDYVATDLTTEQVAETLSNVGFPCEGIERLGDDAVIDVEITSNRGDCLGHIGVARELAAATGRELRLPTVEAAESDRDVTDFAAVEILEPELCGRYTARVIEGVRVGPSPHWVVKRLEAVGMRSINNVVDATNYAMMETGQPPHAFDYARIADGKIIVRKARQGERIVSIDGTDCQLQPEMLVIADAKGPVAVAGVMGGLHTEVSDQTATVLLEDAYFDPVSVRTTSRRLALPSEAAFRFERAVDIEMIDWASRRTAQLIAQLAGGRVAKGVVDVYPKKSQAKKLTLRLAWLNKLVGVEIAPEHVVRILAALSFQPHLQDGLVLCTVPSWRRNDVCREIDLIEEVARVHGYGKIPTERKISIEVVPAGRRENLADSIRTFLNGCGFYEAITVGFVDEGTASLFADSGSTGHLSVRDEAGKTVNLLRQTLIGSLLAVLKTNYNAKNRPCRLFEIADTFVPQPSRAATGCLPREEAKLTLVSDADFRDVRGVIEGLVKSVRPGTEVICEPAELVWAQAGARIMADGSVIGTVGVVSKAVKEKFDFTDVMPVAAEVDFESLLALAGRAVQLKPIPRFPAIQRDLSLIVDEGVRWVQIESAIRAKSPEELEDIQFVEIYRGKGIPSGKKSVTLSLRFRDEDGTLTHEVVDGFQNAIVQSLAESVSAELRTI